METRTFFINENQYEFINSFRGNRSGFVHETTLYRNGKWYGENKIQYYNRTWERYEYQSVMRGCVSKLLEECKKAYKTAWKNDHGIKRLTESKRKEMEEELENNPPKNYAELKKLYARL